MELLRFSLFDRMESYRGDGGEWFLYDVVLRG